MFVITSTICSSKEGVLAMFNSRVVSPTSPRDSFLQWCIHGQYCLDSCRACVSEGGRGGRLEEDGWGWERFLSSFLILLNEDDAFYAYGSMPCSFF